MMVIANRQELQYFLECDRVAMGKKKKRPSVLGDEIWKYERCMRKAAYYAQAGGVRKWFYRLRFHRLSLKLGFSIPYAVCGAGLALVHYGTIVISENCRIGRNCRIHTGVNIGANAGGSAAAVIGDNVYIGPGAKIIGDVKIGNNAVIGANAVVTCDVPDNVTVGGIPARVISSKDSAGHLVRATDIVQNAGK